MNLNTTTANTKDDNNVKVKINLSYCVENSGLPYQHSPSKQHPRTLASPVLAISAKDRNPRKQKISFKQTMTLVTPRLSSPLTFRQISIAKPGAHQGRPQIMNHLGVNKRGPPRTGESPGKKARAVGTV
jgi:hypothetical protein